MASILNSMRPGTELGSVVEQRWAAFGVTANEEAVIVKNFDDAVITGKVGNALNLSKVDTVTAQSIGTTAQMDIGALTLETDTEANSSVSPRDIYAAFAIGENSRARFLRDEDYENKKKRQLQAALMVDIDQQAAALALSLSTSVIGGAGVDISKALVLQGIEKLAQNAKQMYQIGNGGVAYLTIYPLQIGDLYSIPDITSAEMRGDGANPNVTARIWPAWGLQISESGNISTSGGAAHNLLHIKQSHVIAYNVNPMLLPSQRSGLSEVFIAFCSYLVGEFFDEWAVDIQTRTT